MVARQLLISSLILSALTSCRPSSPAPNTSPSTKTLQVYVTNYPLEFFATRIFGDTAEVHFPAPADEDPSFWNPTSEVIQKYQDADVILINGATYEKWIEHASLPESKIVDTSFAFRDQYLKLPEAIVHKHGPEGEHAHEGLATHTWLDPKQARQQAVAIRDAAIKLLPDRAKALQANWQTLDKELGELEDELKATEASEPNRVMWASHPVFDYLGRRCAWNLKSVHWEPDETPSEEEWKKFAALHEQHPAKWMIWEAPPTEATLKRLANEFKIHSFPFYPSGNRPPEGDYLSVMRENIRNLKTSEPLEVELK